MSELVNSYLATWNETDPGARRTLLEQDWAEDAVYTDPLTEANGRDNLDAAIAGVQAQFPGFVFTAIGDSDAHHDQARFRWGLGLPGAEPLVEGFDVVVADRDGLISRVYGFLDKVPNSV